MVIKWYFSFFLFFFFLFKKGITYKVCVYIHKLLSWHFMLILSNDDIIATNHDYQQSQVIFISTPGSC